MRRRLMFLATGLMLATSWLVVGAALAADPSISITPDTSVFFQSGDSVRIWIIASDPDPLDTITVEKSFGTGTYIPNTALAPIYDEFYFQPDTAGVYTFIFPVTDKDGATSADTTIVLAKKVDFSQSANNDSPYPPGDVHWIGSILQQSNSKYYEGMSTLQRLVFINIAKTPGNVHTLNFGHQANKDTAHAYDFLTSWPQGVQAGTEIGGPTMFVNLNECGPEIGPPADLGAICAALHSGGFTAAPDAPDAMGTVLGDDVASAVAAYEALLGNRTVKIYGNAPVSATSMTFNGYTGSTAKSADYTLTWTSSSDSIVIEMAGHLAAGTDPIGQTGVGYGAGRGSAYISGGPYHFSLSTLDGASLGGQDNAINGADIVLPSPVCNVTPSAHSVCVGFEATFTENTSSGTPPYTYCWEKAPYPGGCISTTNQLSITSAGPADAGTYRVIVTDAAGFQDTCYATLLVNSQPTCEITGDSVICPGSTTELCATYDPGYGYLWSNGATTSCITVGSGGAYWVIMTDGNGCADTCYFTVTADDAEPPVVQCPGDITTDNDPGQCGAAVSFSMDATDDCPGVTVSANPTSGSVFPVGTTPVEVIATDVSGNADTCYFDVTVNDTEPPVAQCPGDFDVGVDQGECTATISFAIDATDNCSGVTVSADPASGSTFPIGTTPVEVIATDASGNADTCYFDVTVSDADPPVALCPGDINVDNDAGQCGAIVSFAIDATDNCSGVTVSANPPSGTFFGIGSTPVMVIAVDASGNSDTCYSSVTVNDTEPPLAQCPGDFDVGVDQEECTAIISFAVDATDNCSGVTVSADPASGSTFPVGTTPVEVIATDASGNADTCYFDVTVTNQPPDLTCPESDSAKCMELFASDDFSVYDPDNQSGVVVTLQSVSPSPENTPSIVGNHLEWTPTVSDIDDGPDFTFTLLATDPCGVTDVCQFTVTAYNLPPMLTPPPDDSVHGGDYFVSQDFSVAGDKAPATVSICGITPASTYTPTIVASHVELQTECDEAGTVFTICLEATDTFGAKDTGYFDVTVYNLPPQLTCPADDSVHASVNFVSTDFSVVDPDGDPVTVVYLDIDPAASYPPGLVGNHLEWLTTCAEEGDYFIRLVATDSCGFADTCGFTVRVYDNPPEITCPEDDSVHAGDTFVSTPFSVFDPDGDPPSVWYQGIDPWATNVPTIVDDHVEWVTTCAESGDYVITLVATAGCYPKDTCRFTVTVYNQPPDLICPDDDSVNAGDVFISTDYSVTDPDDTSGVTVILHSVSPTPVYAPVLVDNHVEWSTSCADLVNGPDFFFTLIATDPCGAADTCEFVVTVYNLPPEMTCPDDDSVYAGNLFVSTDFSAVDPSAEPVTVALCGINPTPVHQPGIVASHVEWQTDCADAGNIFNICLEATDSCGAKDTCYLEVTVYNQPPVATCPDDGSVHAGEVFTSTPFSAIDESPGSVVWDIEIGGADPTNVPVMVDQHVEWTTTCADDGDYLFLLIATDECGLSDTCEFTVNVYNQPPAIICPEDGDVHTGDTFVSTDFSATDPDDGSPVVSFLDIAPSATNNPAIVSGHVEWLTTCAESGDYTVRLVVVDPCGAKDTCGFTINVHNQPPQITCPSNGSVTAGETFISGDFTASDPDGDATTVTLMGISPSATYDPDIAGTHVEWVTTGNESGNYTVTLRVTDDCGLWSECSFTVTVITPSQGDKSFIHIPEVDCVNPGEYVCIPILIDNNTTPFGGFELALEYDYTSMTLVDVKPGEAIEGFEYFTYRLLPCPLCGCCKYKILIYGQYDLPNGIGDIGTPIPTTPPQVFQELAQLCFVVNSNENLRGLMIPVCWEWEGTVEGGILVEDWNCGENTFSSWTGDTLYASSLLCQFNASLCDDPGDRIQPLLVFQDSVCGNNCGGVDVCPAGPDECKRGDVNYNYVTYEVADAVLFASYFVEGTSVFRYDMAYQICATDVNADGRTLTLSDLVYLIRVILHDAVEIPKLAPSSEIASVMVTDGVVTTECASQIGALLFEFDGTVTPTLLAGNMEMVANGNKVLVWSRTGQTIQNADVMSYTGAQLVSVQAVDRDSRTLETVITARMTPTAFALHPAYPNPFNPSTNLSFTLPEAASYSMRIYNVAGQLVRSYEGMGSQGLNVITWDGRDNSGSEVSSGVYFFQLTAAGNSATEKMVMMK
jgi:hypothetical protein